MSPCHIWELPQKQKCMPLLLVFSPFFALISWKQIRIRGVHETVLRMELFLNTLTEKPGGLSVCIFDYWLNKECLHPTCIKIQARERLGLQCCPCVFVYMYICRWRVNFRKCFWGQDLRRNNN